MTEPLNHSANQRISVENKNEMEQTGSKQTISDRNGLSTNIAEIKRKKQKQTNKAGYTASGAPKHLYKRVNEKA